MADVLDEKAFGLWSLLADRMFTVSFERPREETHWRLMRETLSDNRVGLYVHFPFCRSFCLYCPYYRELWRNPSFTKYGDVLRKEMRLLGRNLEDKNIVIVDAHAGGGSPSLAPPEFWRQVITGLREYFGFETGLGIEANPEDLVDESRVFSLRDSGVTEVSIGGQSFHKEHLRVLGRRHSGRDVETAVTNCINAGFKLVNLDLMFMVPNVPGEKQLENWRKDIEKAIELGPDQITVYPTLITIYCKGSVLVREGKVRQPVKLFKRFLFEARELLEDYGYKMVRIYSWSRSGEYATVNLEMVGPLLALGAGSMGFTGGYEWANVHSLTEYINALDNDRLPVAVSRRVGLRERAIRLLVDQLFTGGIVSEGSFKDALGHGYEVLPKGMWRSLQFMRLMGWVEKKGDTLRITDKGFVKAHEFVWAFVLKVPCSMTGKLMDTVWPSQLRIP